MFYYDDENCFMLIANIVKALCIERIQNNGVSLAVFLLYWLKIRRDNFYKMPCCRKKLAT